MDWKLHLLLGILFGAAVAHFGFNANAAQIFLFAAIAGVSALVPDIDLRKSKVSRIVYLTGGAAILLVSFMLSGGNWTRMLLYAAVFAIGFLAFDVLVRPRHRGIVHSYLFLVLVAVAAYFAAGFFFAAAFATGYLSHLLSDGVLKTR